MTARIFRSICGQLGVDGWYGQETSDQGVVDRFSLG
jgi:hypothetical protein